MEKNPWKTNSGWSPSMWLHRVPGIEDLRGVVPSARNMGWGPEATRQILITRPWRSRALISVEGMMQGEDRTGMFLLWLCQGILARVAGVRWKQRNQTHIHQYQLTPWHAQGGRSLEGTWREFWLHRSLSRSKSRATWKEQQAKQKAKLHVGHLRSIPSTGQKLPKLQKTSIDRSRPDSFFFFAKRDHDAFAGSMATRAAAAFRPRRRPQRT